MRGQYTHGAIWTVMAFAALGDSKRAWELFNLINPITHAATPEAAALYRVEPYVVAADVYGVPPHTGRGGWTWYTGSAGWMYRLIVESLLGLQVEGNTLSFRPCLPPDWPPIKMHYRHGGTFYHIALQQGSDAARVTCDGVDQPGGMVALLDDGGDHAVEVQVFVSESRSTRQ